MIHATSGRSRRPAFSASPARSSPSIPARWCAPLLIAGAAAAGVVAWSGQVLLLPVATIFPALWAFAPSRAVAAVVAAAYFLGAARGLPQGVANFYAADLWPGFLLWAAASASFVVVHAAAWIRRPGGGRAVRYLAAAVAVAVPPLGITGWAHPLTAAGVLFPGLGWWGLAAAAACLAMMTSRFWPAVTIALGGFWLLSATTWTPPPLPHGWKGVDLELGESLGRNTSLDRHRDLIATVQSRAGEGDRFVVLPESALGFWTPTVARVWQDGLEGSEVIVIAGAAVINAGGYDNVMVAISADEGRIWSCCCRASCRFRPTPMLRRSSWGQDRWNAGVTMMRAADPEGWRGVVDSSQLARDNAEAIGQCAEVARTAGQDQQCTIVVKAPET